MIKKAFQRLITTGLAAYAAVGLFMPSVIRPRASAAPYPDGNAGNKTAVVVAKAQQALQTAQPRHQTLTLSRKQDTGLLKKGSHGPAVAVLQKSLNRLFANTATAQPLQVDGKFGVLTEQALRKAQISVSVTPTGIYGQYTQAAFREHGLLTKEVEGIRVPILMYHGTPDGPAQYSSDVTFQQFRDQMQALKQAGYQAISLDQLTRAINGQSKLPEKPFVITFDDGYQSNQNVLPILEELQFSATFFVNLNNKERIPKMSDALLRKIDAHPLFEVAFHGEAHKNLATSGPQIAYQEIIPGKRTLESILGSPVNYFCYPHGGTTPYAKQLVAGTYRLGFGVRGENSQTKADITNIPRVPVGQHIKNPEMLLMRMDQAAVPTLTQSESKTADLLQKITEYQDIRRDTDVSGLGKTLDAYRDFLVEEALTTLKDSTLPQKDRQALNGFVEKELEAANVNMMLYQQAGRTF